jgi:hypothetical protein
MTVKRLANGAASVARQHLESEVDELRKMLGEVGLELAVLRTEFEELRKAVNFKPRSQRAMTEEDARRVVLGDLAPMPSKQAAVLTGLSYGQVYSARNGYTFKEVYEQKQKMLQREKEAAILREVMAERK